MKLPNFIVIGAYKSGTTSLYEYFRQHPEVYMSRVKEPNYFAHQELTEAANSSSDQAKAITSIKEYAKLFENAGPEQVVGEASPAYLNFSPSAERIAAVIPEVKLIAILRNPAEAFYSDHNMRIREHRNVNRDFQERLQLLKSRIQRGEAAGPMYHQQLSTYYDCFPAEQIKVYLYEDLRENGVEMMRDAYRFCGVSDQFKPDTQVQRNVGGLPRFPTVDKALKAMIRSPLTRRISGAKPLLLRLRVSGRRKPPTMPNEWKRQITEAYQEDIERLATLIDRDLNHWLT